MPVYTIESNTNIVDAAGLARLQYAIVDSDGVPMGRTGSIAQGAYSGMGIHVAARKAGGAIEPPREVDSAGDDGGYLQKFVFGPAKLATMDLDFGILNADFLAAVSKTNVVTVNEWPMFGLETNKVTDRQICLLYNVQAKDADANFGAVRWLNFFSPLVMVYPLFSASEDAKDMSFPFRGSRVRSAYTPWYTAFTQATHGYTRTAQLGLISRAPLTMTTFVGNGAVSSVILDYAPTTDHTGWGVYVIREGVVMTRTTDYTVNIATKTITFNTIPTAGQRVVILYEADGLV